MGVFYTNWEIAGILIHMGEIIKNYCEEYNKNHDLYGLASYECQYMVGQIMSAISCIKAFPDLSVDLVTDNYGHYVKLQILVHESPCGLPWDIKVWKEGNNEKQ